MSANSYWYLGLAILSAALLLYIFIKKREVRSVLLFIAMIGFGYIIETIIYTFLGSYQYYPKFIEDNAYFDSNLGAIASNALALPTIAVFLSTFRLGWIWILVFTGIFVGIEWLFRELHIYADNWWRLGYTAIGLLVYFPFAKWLYHSMFRPLSGFVLGLLLFLIALAISDTLNIVPIMAFSNRVYEPGWFQNPSRDTTAFGTVYCIAVSLFITFVVTRYWKHAVSKYLFALLCIMCVEMALKAAGIQRSLVWWDEWYFLLINFGLLAITQAICNYLMKGPPIWKM
ncbi:hypothetical protein ACFOLF_32285 [Paenibacillus sepulcri]|uniref:Uncharacterized protein n=1 Tax=Paenibacillus sepulcri TaxID=359917 RepID=A0ABS7CBN8_9BACL|nr:hypothetical protein [Paenibacillus sepulcri]